MTQDEDRAERASKAQTPAARVRTLTWATVCGAFIGYVVMTAVIESGLHIEGAEAVARSVGPGLGVMLGGGLAAALHGGRTLPIVLVAASLFLILHVSEGHRVASLHLWILQAISVLAGGWLAFLRRA